MRNKFITKLAEYASRDPAIVFITGDLGYSVVEPFQENYPERFINAGICEQNMTGLAAGLALTGKKAFTYSIANFSTMRCLEQIRNDIVYHDANVKIISVGSGFSYGTQGYTHHGIEDIAIMRALPGMQVICPADAQEALKILDYLILDNKPAYIRLAKKGEPPLHKARDKNVASFDAWTFPQMIPLRTGFKKTILCTGTITYPIYQHVVENLLEYNVFSVPVIKPLDLDTLTIICNESYEVLTVEEHQRTGGFGSHCLEAINELFNLNHIKNFPIVKRYGVSDEINSCMTSEEFTKQIILQAFSK